RRPPPPASTIRSLKIAIARYRRIPDFPEPHEKRKGIRMLSLLRFFVVQFRRCAGFKPPLPFSRRSVVRRYSSSRRRVLRRTTSYADSLSRPAAALVFIDSRPHHWQSTLPVNVWHSM